MCTTDNTASRQAEINRDTSHTADRFSLYTTAVQNPRRSVELCSRLFQQQYGNPPKVVREDFCGTAANCVAWAKLDNSARLIGVDIDPQPLDWCRRQLVPHLSDQQRARIELICADVLQQGLPPADLILALNCSFCVIKKRLDLLQYLRQCHQALGRQGMLILEVYGGPEAQMTGRDIIPCEGFTAIWEQETFNAVTNETITHLHFHFPDGHEIRRAFSYDWRLWSAAELLDAIEEAGFCGSSVYSTGAENGRTPVSCGSANVSTHWTLYVAGWT